MFKSKVLFLSEKKIFLSKSSDLWEGYDPDSWPKNLQQKFIKQNLQILCKTFGKARRGAHSKLIFLWRGFIASWEKELKIATLTEAPFMVKLDFWKKTNIFSSNICAIISGENIWNSHKHSTWPFSCLVPMKNCAFRPPKKCNWNIWMLIKWGAQLKNISEIFGGI